METWKKLRSTWKFITCASRYNVDRIPRNLIYHTSIFEGPMRLIKTIGTDTIYVEMDGEVVREGAGGRGDGEE